MATNAKAFAKNGSRLRRLYFFTVPSASAVTVDTPHRAARAAYAVRCATHKNESAVAATINATLITVAEVAVKIASVSNQAERANTNAVRMQYMQRPSLLTDTKYIDAPARAKIYQFNRHFSGKATTRIRPDGRLRDHEEQTEARSGDNLDEGEVERFIK